MLYPLNTDEEESCLKCILQKNKLRKYTLHFEEVNYYTGLLITEKQIIPKLGDLKKLLIISYDPVDWVSGSSSLNWKFDWGFVV